MSTQTSILEVKTAMVTIARADSVLCSGSTPLITGFWDEGAVPLQQKFPYCTIGDADELPLNTFKRRGYNPVVTVHVWSRDTGFDECSTILASLNRLFDQQPLSLATQTHIYTMYKHSHSLNDPDNMTRHLVIEYELMTQE